MPINMGKFLVDCKASHSRGDNYSILQGEIETSWIMKYLMKNGEMYIYSLQN